MLAKYLSRPPLWFFVSVSFLAGIICCAQFYGDEFLRGWDAYYYVLKTVAWFERGQWAVSDGNFIHLLLSPLKWLGLSAKQAWQLWPGISISLFLLSFAKNIRLLKHPATAVILFAWGVLSPSIFYLAVDFPKTFFALICFNFVFFYTLAKKPLLWCIFACAAVWLHKIMLPYVGLCAFWMCWTAYHSSDIRRQTVWPAMAALGIFLLCLQQTTAFSIDSSDLARLEGGVLTPGIVYLINRATIPFGLRTELISSLLLGCILLWKYPYRLRYAAISWLGALVPVCSPQTFGLGERTALLFPYTIMLSCLWLALEYPAAPPKKNRKNRWIFVAAVLLSAAFFRPLYSLQPSHKENIRNILLTDALRAYQIPMLIAAPKFNYFYKFYTGRESFPFEPEENWDKTALWRLVNSATEQDLRPFLSSGCSTYMHEIFFPNGESSGNTLLREDCYEELRRAVPPGQFLHKILHTNAINPWKKRPIFLRKKSAGAHTAARRQSAAFIHHRKKTCKTGTSGDMQPSLPADAPSNFQRAGCTRAKNLLQIYKRPVQATHMPRIFYDFI